MNRRAFLATLFAAPVAPVVAKAVAAAPVVVEAPRVAEVYTTCARPIYTQEWVCDGQYLDESKFNDRDAQLFLKNLVQGMNETIEAEIERMYTRRPFPLDLNFPASDIAWFTKDGVRVL